MSKFELKLLGIIKKCINFAKECKSSGRLIQIRPSHNIQTLNTSTKLIEWGEMWEAVAFEWLTMQPSSIILLEKGPHCLTRYLDGKQISRFQFTLPSVREIHWNLKKDNFSIHSNVSRLLTHLDSKYVPTSFFVFFGLIRPMKYKNTCF